MGWSAHDPGAEQYNSDASCGGRLYASDRCVMIGSYRGTDGLTICGSFTQWSPSRWSFGSFDGSFGGDGEVSTSSSMCDSSATPASRLRCGDGDDDDVELPHEGVGLVYIDRTLALIGLGLYSDLIRRCCSCCTAASVSRGDRSVSATGSPTTAAPPFSAPWPWSWPC